MTKWQQRGVPLPRQYCYSHARNMWRCLRLRLQMVVSHSGNTAMFLDCLAMARQGFSATLYGCSTLSCFLEEFGVAASGPIYGQAGPWARLRAEQPGMRWPFFWGGFRSDNKGKLRGSQVSQHCLEPFFGCGRC